MSSESGDVVVVGGGAAGCAVAYYLGRAGVGSIIVERDGVAANASGYSAGGLNPLEGAGIPGPLSGLAISSYRMHREIWPELSQHSNIDFEPSIVSSVRVAFDDADLAEIETTSRLFDAADDDFSAEWLDASQLRELEPRVSPAALGGLDAWGNAALSSYRFTLALAACAKTMGSTVLSSTVTGVETSGCRVTAVRTLDGLILCDAIVFANGPWSADVESWLGIPVPIRPYKGEILRMTLPSGPLKHDFQGAGVSLYHRESEQVWAGATEEEKGFDMVPSAQARKSLSQGAARLMPEMEGAELVLHTACLRPLSPDWLPIIGRAPGWDNAYVATGAGKKGILLSTGIGKAVADLIASGKTEMPVGGFGPERFID